MEWWPTLFLPIASLEMAVTGTSPRETRTTSQASRTSPPLLPRTRTPSKITPVSVATISTRQLKSTLLRARNFIISKKMLREGSRRARLRETFNLSSLLWRMAVFFLHSLAMEVLFLIAKWITSTVSISAGTIGRCLHLWMIAQGQLIIMRMIKMRLIGLVRLVQLIISPLIE